MDNLINNDNKAVRIIHTFENWVLVTVTSLIVLLSGVQIILRNFFDSGIAWIPPMLGVLVIWVGLLGALIATRNNAHIKINILTTYLRDQYKPIAFALSHLFSAAILVVLTYYSFEFVNLNVETGSTAFGEVPVWVTQSILPVTCLLMSLRYMAYTVINVTQILGKYSQ